MEICELLGVSPAKSDCSCIETHFKHLHLYFRICSILGEAIYVCLYISSILTGNRFKSCVVESPGALTGGRFPTALRKRRPMKTNQHFANSTIDDKLHLMSLIIGARQDEENRCMSTFQSI